MRVPQRNDTAREHDAALGQDQVRYASTRIRDCYSMPAVEIAPAFLPCGDAGRWSWRAVVNEGKYLALERQLLYAEITKISFQSIDLFDIGRHLDGEDVRLDLEKLSRLDRGRAWASMRGQYFLQCVQARHDSCPLAYRGPMV
jgi:hypothetical protein